MVMWLSSYRTVRFPSARWPAIEAASLCTPSMMSPSLAITQVRWSTTLIPGMLNRSAAILAAIAMPTALPNPCPSGPVVVSTPGAQPCSGWPGVMLPHCRNLLISSSGRS